MFPCHLWPHVPASSEFLPPFMGAFSSCIASPWGTPTIASFPKVSCVCVCVCACGMCVCVCVCVCRVCVCYVSDFAEGLAPRHGYITCQHYRQVKIDIPFLKNLSIIPISWKCSLSLPQYCSAFLSHLLSDRPPAYSSQLPTFLFIVHAKQLSYLFVSRKKWPVRML